MAVPISQAIQNTIAQDYISILGRYPDSTGFSYWTNILANNNGTTAANTAIVNLFAVQPEFVNIYGGLQTNAAISLMYTNVLQRPVDGSGLAYWSNFANTLITTGAVSSVAQAYAQTASAIITTAASNGTADQATITARTAAAVASGTATPTTTTTLTFGGTSPTFTTGTAVPAGALTLNDNSNGAGNAVTTAMPAGATVLASQMTVNTAGTDTLTADVSSAPWASVTALTANTGGAAALTGTATQNITSNSTAGGVSVVGGNAVTVTAAGGAVTVGGLVATTASPAGAITVTQSKAVANAVAVDGGTSITVSQTGANFATAATADITVGANLATTGTVTVNATSGTANGNTIGAISVKGGSVVTVNEAAGNTAAVGNNVVMGNVSVQGTVATTSVVVNQAAVATGAAAVAAVTGVVAVGATAASPGVNAVAAVAAVTAVTAVAAAVGVTADGTVTIVDKVATAGLSTAGTTSGGTITSATLNNFGAAQVNSPALTTLNLSGTGAAVTTYEGGTLSTTNTALTVNVNGLTSASLTDASNQFTTLNVVAGATKSTLGAITDTALKTIAISGNSVVALTPAASVTSVTVSGAAGFTGAITDTTTSFVSTGSGVNTVTIAADATKAITAGTSNADVLVLGAVGGTFTAGKTGVLVSGFEVLGMTAASTGTTNAAVFGSSVTGITTTAALGAIEILTGVNKGASVSFGAFTTAGGLTVNYADATGASDTTTVTLAGGTASVYGTGVAQTVSALTLQDVNGVGVGTVNFVDNNAGFNTTDIITAFTDTGLANLGFSGTGGLSITNTTNATALTINNTGTGVTGLTLTETANSAGTITFTGTGLTTVALTDTVAGVLSLVNSGTGTVVVTDGGANTVATTVNLTGAMTVTLTDSNVSTWTLADGQNVTLVDNKATGLTLNAGATGGVSTVVDNLTVGNANNVVSDTSLSNTVNITVGTGSNGITVGAATTDTTGVYNVILGAHTATTGRDDISVGTAGTNFATANNLTVTGAVTGDHIILAADAGATLVGTGLTAGAGTITATTLTGALTVQAAIGLLETAVAATAHHIAVGQFGGNTYIVEANATAAAAGTNTTVVELVGLHTVSATAATGYVVVAS